MNLGLIEKTSVIGLALVGCDYITSLGLAQMLVDAPYLNVVGSAASGGEALALLETGLVQLVLIDAAMGREKLLDVCTQLSKPARPSRVVVMGTVEFELAEHLLLLGVKAIVSHARVAEDLPTLLRIIHGGGALVLNSQALRALKDRSVNSNKGYKERYDGLNARERAVAAGIAAGLTNLQLALELHLSEATIKILVSAIMNKLGADNRVQIAVLVTKANFV